jgi:hypothetical protein
MTPSSPPTVGRVGSNCGGRFTALLFDLSTIFPLGCFFLGVILLFNNPLALKSTPLVSSVATQLLAQLKTGKDIITEAKTTQL